MQKKAKRKKEATKVVARDGAVLHLIIHWGLRWCKEKQMP